MHLARVHDPLVEKDDHYDDDLDDGNSDSDADTENSDGTGSNTTATTANTAITKDRGQDRALVARLKATKEQSRVPMTCLVVMAELPVSCVMW